MRRPETLSSGSDAVWQGGRLARGTHGVQWRRQDHLPGPSVECCRSWQAMWPRCAAPPTISPGLWARRSPTRSRSGVLSASIMSDLVDNPVIPMELKAQVDPDAITFVGNELLQEALERTGATHDQVAEAVHINTQARLRSLTICLIALTGLALVAIFPAGALPGCDGE